MRRVRSAALLHDIVGPVNLEVPGAPVPVVEASKIEYPGTFQIEGDVGIIAELVEKVARIRVPSTAVVRTSHVGPHSDTLIGQAMPHTIGVKSHREDWWLLGGSITLNSRQAACPGRQVATRGNHRTGPESPKKFSPVHEILL
jgi:hypothetical protein